MTTAESMLLGMTTHTTHVPSHPNRVGRAARLVALPAITTVSMLSLTSPASADQATEIACGATVTRSVRLTADLLDCPGSGIIVGAPGITIDLAGHLIDGTGAGAGIDNEAGHDGVRIIGGTIREFTFGVNLFQANNARFHRITLVANAVGFKVANSANVELDRVTALDNAGPGVEITFAEEVTVRRSTATGNGQGGIVDRFSTGSRHIGNTATANGGSGLTLDNVAGAVLRRNDARGNGIDGIELVGVDDAHVFGNTAIGNRGNGISIDRPANTVTANRANGNGGIGITAPDGTINGGHNRANGNGGGDCTGIRCR